MWISQERREPRKPKASRCKRGLASISRKTAGSSDFAPQRNPEIVVAALVQGAGWGSFVAPIVRDVVKAYYDKKAGRFPSAQLALTAATQTAPNRKRRPMRWQRRRQNWRQIILALELPAARGGTSAADGGDAVAATSDRSAASGAIEMKVKYQSLNAGTNEEFGTTTGCC